MTSYEKKIKKIRKYKSHNEVLSAINKEKEPLLKFMLFVKNSKLFNNTAALDLFHKTNCTLIKKFILASRKPESLLLMYLNKDEYSNLCKEIINGGK